MPTMKEASHSQLAHCSFTVPLVGAPQPSGAFCIQLTSIGSAIGGALSVLADLVAADRHSSHCCGGLQDEKLIACCLAHCILQAPGGQGRSQVLQGITRGLWEPFASLGRQ